MKRLFALLALIVALALPGVALADGYGSFTDANGLHCTYYVTGNMASVNCSGYVYRSSGSVYMSYHCSGYYYSYSGWQWNCS